MGNDGPGTADGSTRRCVLAIDPGRAKCGLAVVDDTLAVLERTVVGTSDLMPNARRLLEMFRPAAVLVGNGTGASAVRDSVAALKLDCPLYEVDEAHTSEAARARYVHDIPARGLRRCLPRSLRTPEEPYDDYVAVILAERWWRAQTS